MMGAVIGSPRYDTNTERRSYRAEVRWLGFFMWMVNWRVAVRKGRGGDDDVVLRA